MSFNRNEPNAQLSLMFFICSIVLYNVIHLCGYSGLDKGSVSNVMEPSPVPELEVPQENPNHLHRLVSEGDTAGVRLVGVMHLFSELAIT